MTTQLHEIFWCEECERALLASELSCSWHESARDGCGCPVRCPGSDSVIRFVPAAYYDGILFAVVDAVKHVPTYEGRVPTRVDLLQSVRRAANAYSQLHGPVVAWKVTDQATGLFNLTFGEDTAQREREAGKKVECLVSFVDK